MTQKNFFRLVSLVFLVVALVHLLRAFNGWELAFNGKVLPMWTSWVGFVVGTWFSYTTNKMNR